MSKPRDVKRLLAVLKHRAKKAGLPFSLTEKDIVIPNKCPIMGQKIKINGKNNDPMLPSVDRLVPDRGYTPENIRIISRKANMVKQDLTNPEIFEKMAKYIRANVKLPKKKRKCRS